MNPGLDNSIRGRRCRTW